MHFNKPNTHSKPVPVVSYKRCKAKTNPDGSPGMTVTEHCRIVGAVAEQILEQLPGWVKGLFPQGSVALAAAHDVGKISPGFQKKYFNTWLRTVSPALAKMDDANFEQNHAVISEAALIYWYAKHGLVKCNDWAQVAGWHHGKRQKPDVSTIGPVQTPQIYGGQAWENERQALLEDLFHTFGEPPNVTPDLIKILVASGLVTAADWIGSNEILFPDGTDTENRDHLMRVANNALSAIGWTQPKVKKGMSFKEVFGFTPNSIQKEMTNLVKGPGLYIIEAPMGMGKTEAALYAGYRLMETGQARGLYFALPTRLTSNRIHDRVNRFLKNITDKNAMLIHSTSWLEGLNDAHKGEMQVGHSWFNPRKRALLYPFGVGTIDQALLSVLRVKHFFLRLFGLAGKVVILDEVHSYDMYTGTLLDLLVKQLLGLGATVIILSATLTAERKKDFTGVTASKLDFPLLSVASDSKPLIESSAQPPATKKVLLSLTDQDDTTVAKQAVAKAAQGCCVVWIQDTVQAAQDAYNLVKAEMSEDQFEVGLLHSRFPLYRRNAIENKWLQLLGKNGKRSERGAILISTQVVEQSVDIDADFMITEIAPMDMILQRMGRLWRHERKLRPVDYPEVWVLTRGAEHADNAREFKNRLKSIGKVYAPYVIWRTLEVLGQQTDIGLPNDIRALLASTYEQSPGTEPDWVEQLRQELDKNKEDLQRMALSMTAQALPALDDDERAATRYSTIQYNQVLLVRSFDTTGDRVDITLASRDKVSVERDQRDLGVIKKLYENLVSVPAYYLPDQCKPIDQKDVLKDCFYMDVYVLEIHSDARLTCPGFGDTPLMYTDERGVERDNEYTQNTGDYDEFDW